MRSKPTIVIVLALLLSLTANFQNASGAATLDFGSTTAANAYSEVQKRMASIQKYENPNINYVIAPKTNPKFLALANNSLKFAANYYSDLLPLATPITAWVIDDRGSTNWTIDALSATGVDPFGYKPSFLRQVSGTPAKSRDGSMEILIFSTQYPDRLGAGDQYEISHEFTHLPQTFAMPNGKGSLLCWQREGMAEYGAIAISGRFSPLRYQQETLHGTHFVMNLKTSFGADWVTYFKQNESRSTGACAPEDYGIGALAFQYLEGTYGRSKVYDFIKNLGEIGTMECPEFKKDGVPCQQWRDSVKTAFGVSVEDLYPKIAQFINGQIAWAKNLKEIPYSSLVKRDPKAFSYPKFLPPTSKPAAGQVCKKTGAEIKLNNTIFTCTVFETAKFYSNIKEDIPWFIATPKPKNSELPQNKQTPDPNYDSEAPEGTLARGRLCLDLEVTVKSWKNEQLTCIKNSKGTMVWALS
jgi:hypothetical protein